MLLSRPLLSVLLIWTLAMIALTALSGIQHDYIYYHEQWMLVLNRLNPWSTNNAYGPLHNAFALLLPIHDMAPKFASAGLFLAANATLLFALARTRPVDEWIRPYLAGIGLNALVIVSAFVYGLNDAFVAALVIFAILARRNEQMLLAGVLLGLATLDKYYPALLLPFFALDRRSFSAKLMLSGLVTIAIGIGIAALLWRNDFFEAVMFGVNRDATIFSILKPLAVLSRAYGDPFGIVLQMIRFNGPLVVAVFINALLLAWLRRENWLTGATWSLFLVLIFYKVGNPQFFVTWCTLLACLPLLRDADADRLAKVSIPFAIFVTIYELGYALLPPIYYHGWLAPVNDYVGFFVFGFGLWTVIRYMRTTPASAPQRAVA
jgi:hypothetical protein